MFALLFAALIPISWIAMVTGAIGFIVHLIIALTEAADKGEGGLLIFGILTVAGWGSMIVATLAAAIAAAIAAALD